MQKEHTHILFMAHKQEDLIHPSLIYLIKIHTLINPICVINFFQRFNSLNGTIKFIIDIIVRQSKKNPNNQRYIYLWYKRELSLL